jgi:hypothetical protein
MRHSTAYDTEDISYFVSHLRAANCDLICLQEAHVSLVDGDRGQIGDLAELLSYGHAWHVPISESHIEIGRRLAIGALSRTPIFESKYFRLRNPHLSAIGPDGQLWKSFNKGVASFKVTIGGRIWNVVTGHSYPFHHFHRFATEPDFLDINGFIDDLIVSMSASGDCLAVMDLNHDKPWVLFPRAFQKGVKEAFSNVATIPKGQQWDHILYSPPTKLRNFEVFKGLADHYLAIAEFEPC